MNRRALTCKQRALVRNIIAICSAFNLIDGPRNVSFLLPFCSLVEHAARSAKWRHTLLDSIVATATLLRAAWHHTAARLLARPC